MSEHLIIQKYREYNLFGAFIEMDFAFDQNGDLSYIMPISEKHLATPVTAHGGAIAAMMDGLMGVKGLSLVAHEMKVLSTVEFKISYFMPVRLGDILQGKAYVLKQGKKIIFLEGEIFNQNNELVAKGSGTFNTYDAFKAKMDF
jgi:uncharacterized protein (TIGR00369 family)